MRRPSASLARRSLVSLTWNSIANLTTLPVSFVQTVLLARLLPVEYFGIHAGLLAFSGVAWALLESGFAAAFLHRAPETEDEEQSMAVFFTLRVLVVLVWMAGLALVALVFLRDVRRMALLSTAVGGGLLRIANAGQVLLHRRVAHRRLAVMDMLQTGLVFGLSLGIAAWSGSIWALLVGPWVMALVFGVLLFAWRPVWRPRFSLDTTILRYFLNYGRRASPGVFLGAALDHMDDLWTNLYLGDLALGFYSRAYRFATYPRIILADPLNALALGIYAELKQDRRRLSRAFFQINALLVRSSFGLGGLMVAVAPQLVRVLLGERWLPMTTALQLLLIYALLEPLKQTIAYVLAASGRPEQVSRVRLLQLVVLLGGLYALGPRWGIIGVALAVDLMALLGVILLLRAALRLVDVSLLRLFAPPGLALLAGAAVVELAMLGLEQAWQLAHAPWLALVVGACAYSAAYGLVLLALERRALWETVREALAMVARRQPEAPAEPEPPAEDGCEI